MQLNTTHDNIKLCEEIIKNKHAGGFYMHRPIAPNIRQWYQAIDKNEMFRVIAENAVEDFIEIQYFSGEIEELDFDTWFSTRLEAIPPPEDSSGPFELTQEELGYDSEIKLPENRFNPLYELDLHTLHSSSFDNYDYYNKYEQYESQYESYDKFFDKKHFF